MRIVLANGCFDGPQGCHAGHIDLLARASVLGDRLIVAINSDASCRRLKGPTRPLADESTRAAALLKIHGVHRVLVFDSESELKALLRGLKPWALVKGYGSGPTPGQEFAGRVIYLSLVEGISTTILERANGS